MLQPSTTVFAMLALVVATVGRHGLAADNDDGSDAVEPVAKEFLRAFADADPKKMGEHFADKVLVASDVMRSVDPDTPREPKEYNKDKLIEAYSKLFDKIGRDRWSGVLKKVEPTMTKASKDGQQLGFVKAGDFVYDLHFREAAKGKGKGLDEAVIFVFRKIDGQYRVVSHFADY